MTVIYTIGHSNLPIEKFIGLLHKNNIMVFVDIRSAPYSRFYPHFNKEKLNTSIDECGISYLFEGSRLGGRIKDMECYNSKILPERTDNIAELIDYDVLKNRSWFNDGIMDLIKLADVQKSAIMCSEENPARCHRNLFDSKVICRG